MGPLLLDHQHVWRTYVNAGRLKGVDDPHYPEEWISSVTEAVNPNTGEGEGLSRVAGTDDTLRRLIERDPAGMLGARRARHGGGMGVLTKCIDAGERLTIQVHPDVARARELFDSPYGKTECWYFLDDGCGDVASKPCVYCGFKQGVTREQWERLFADQDIPGMLACMHRIEVEPGMVVLVRGGMPHAIGEGCYLVEVQEPTDLTIRVERTTPSGFAVADEMCHLGLGFTRMFDCFDYATTSLDQMRELCIVKPETIWTSKVGSYVELVGEADTPCFAMRRLAFEADGSMTLPDEDDFRILYVVKGSGTVASASESGLGASEVAISAGDQLFVPASAGGCTVTMDASAEVLELRGPVVDGDASAPSCED